MIYYFISEGDNRILDILYCPGDSKATPKQIKDVAQALLPHSKHPIYVVEGRHTGLRFLPPRKEE